VPRLRDVVEHAVFDGQAGIVVVGKMAVKSRDWSRVWLLRTRPHREGISELAMTEIILNILKVVI
jgi:hypothetical protein